MYYNYNIEASGHHRGSQQRSRDDQSSSSNNNNRLQQSAGSRSLQPPIRSHNPQHSQHNSFQSMTSTLQTTHTTTQPIITSTTTKSGSTSSIGHGGGGLSSPIKTISSSSSGSTSQLNKQNYVPSQLSLSSSSTVNDDVSNANEKQDVDKLPSKETPTVEYDFNRAKNLFEHLIEEINKGLITHDDCMDDLKKIPEKEQEEFIREMLNTHIERNSIKRIEFSNILATGVQKKIISKEIYLLGLNGHLVNATDIIIDVPKYWDYLAEMLGKFYSSNTSVVNEFIFY